MLRFEDKSNEETQKTIKKYKAVKISYGCDGEPRVCICTGWFEIIEIEQDGTIIITKLPDSLKDWNTTWEDVLMYVYEFDTPFDIVDCFEEFDITIIKRK